MICVTCQLDVVGLAVVNISFVPLYLGDMAFSKRLEVLENELPLRFGPHALQIAGVSKLSLHDQPCTQAARPETHD